MKTNPESQNIEWKLLWKDDYLKWICGFANAQGGRIYIGINNNGKAVGVMLDKDPRAKRYEMERANEDDIRSLMEEIPNKVQSALSLVVDVNLSIQSGVYVIEIIVSPSPMPINYHGEYYYRVGSTNKVLTGAELNQFLLSRSGSQWDAVGVKGISVDELDRESFDIFRREAVRSRRMKKEDLDMGPAELLDKLGLVTDGQLSRAAILLFHRNPERVSRGCCVRIGMFGEGGEILYQDEVQGSLFIIADRVVDLIYLKYLKASIHYEKETRVETYPYPRDAIREIIFNALIHSNWSAHNDIQVRINENSICISNCCILPMGWTLKTLMGAHRSHAKNPSIAKTFQRAGYVEVWGRGIEKIMEACRRNGNPPPEYALVGEDLSVNIVASERARIASPAWQATAGTTLSHRILSEIRRSGNLNPHDLAATLQVPPSLVQQIMLTLIGGGADIGSKIDASNAKVDTLNAKVDDSDAKVDALGAKVDDSNAKVDAMMRMILTRVQESPHITQIQLAKEMNVAPWRVKESMRRLTQSGLLVRIGGKKQGIWKPLS